MVQSTDAHCVGLETIGGRAGIGSVYAIKTVQNPALDRGGHASTAKAATARRVIM